MYGDGVKFILEKSIELSQLYLLTKGEFYPFALVLTNDGAVNHLYQKTDGDEPVKEVFEKLVETLYKKTEQPETKAVALISNMKVEKESGAQMMLRLDVDSAGEPCLTYGLPYRLTDDGGIDFADPVFDPGQYHFFKEDPPAKN